MWLDDENHDKKWGRHNKTRKFYLKNEWLALPTLKKVRKCHICKIVTPKTRYKL